jgi:hemoglobin
MKPLLLAKWIIFPALACALFLQLTSTACAQEKKEKSLYQRLGGYDAIAAVVDDFVPRLAGDPQLGKFFAGHATSSLKKIRQLVIDQLCEATGGPCVYTGRTMKDSHKGLGITDAQWQLSVNHLVASLDKFKVPQKEKDELLAIASTLKGDIVDVQAAAQPPMK